MKDMKKKLLLIAVLVLVAGLMFFAYNRFLAPQGVEGAKEVSLEIAIEDQDIEDIYTYNTDHEFLYDLLKEYEDELGISFEEFSYGTMLTGLMNYLAQQDNQEFFHIGVNGEGAEYGIKELVLNDGDQFKIELTTW